jgi:hypothetical protein
LEEDGEGVSVTASVRVALMMVRVGVAPTVVNEALVRKGSTEVV